MEEEGQTGDYVVVVVVGGLVGGKMDQGASKSSPYRTESASISTRTTHHRRVRLRLERHSKNVVQFPLTIIMPQAGTAPPQPTQPILHLCKSIWNRRPLIMAPVDL